MVNCPIADLDVVMATCNGHAFLGDQLRSIFRQTWLPRRIFIHDDASDDATPELLERICQEAPAGLQVSLRRNPSRLGVKQNFNQALLALQRLGASAWIMLADQDDLWLPTKIEDSLVALQMALEERGSSVPCLGFSDLILIDASGVPTGQTLFECLRIDPKRRSLDELMLCNVFTGCTMVFNRACFDLALPIPDRARLHDTWIGLVAAACGEVIELPYPTVLYRQHTANVLGARNGDRLRWADLIAQLRQGRVAELYVHPNVDQALALLERYGDSVTMLRERYSLGLLEQLKHASPLRRLNAARKLQLRDQRPLRQLLWWFFLLWPRQRRLSGQSPGFVPYRLRLPVVTTADRPRILHVLANVQTGGSTRLVVDLIEHLSGEYEQRVLTSFAPFPPEYEGLDVVELPHAGRSSLFVEQLQAFQPHLLHVHYWGGCDRRWYRQVFKASENLRLPVVQNVNTPVAPYRSSSIVANVYVSDYLRVAFGVSDRCARVIYPGSNFSLFQQASVRSEGPTVGMVYRLENDKLDPRAIDVFIAIARSQPDARCLIVGGGSQLPRMKAQVHVAGLEDRFEFTDYVSYGDLPGYYARMRVFVAPVASESFGQVTPFAMSMGLPVVGFRVGALPEQLRQPSLLADPGDVDGLAALACGLLRDPAACRRIGALNCERAHQLYSVESMVEAYQNLYRQYLRVDR